MSEKNVKNKRKLPSKPGRGICAGDKQPRVQDLSEEPPYDVQDLDTDGGPPTTPACGVRQPDEVVEHSARGGMYSPIVGVVLHPYDEGVQLTHSNGVIDLTGDEYNQ